MSTIIAEPGSVESDVVYEAMLDGLPDDFYVLPYPVVYGHELGWLVVAPSGIYHLDVRDWRGSVWANGEEPWLVEMCIRDSIQYEELVEAQRFSPDGRYSLFVRSVSGIAQIFIQDPPTSQFPNPQPRQLTEAGGLCYDPVWSPDGSTIAFVSQASGSDDIHTMRPDGSGVRNVTPNKCCLLYTSRCV